jgi:hypothetical protein
MMSEQQLIQKLRRRTATRRPANLHESAPKKGSDGTTLALLKLDRARRSCMYDAVRMGAGLILGELGERRRLSLADYAAFFNNPM